MSDDALPQSENNAQSTGQNENVCCEFAVIGTNHTMPPKHRRQLLLTDQKPECRAVVPRSFF